MAHTLQFQVGPFELDVNDDCYLVSVRETRSGSNHQSRYSEIPAWVFHSKHAIWLMDEESSILERATKGELIKKRLLAFGATGK
ncbi:MAG TPA: hypothetical protein VJ521_03655 [Acidobacteriota bacterium]|nr:hypothetical protein [Acidobacteriota bacterium]